VKNARQIPDFPDYSITRKGEVYRVTPYGIQAKGRYGEVPRRITVVMCGQQPYALSPSVTLCGRDGGRAFSAKRTVRALMRAVWPEVEWKA
jgi:hypothetical protein